MGGLGDLHPLSDPHGAFAAFPAILARAEELEIPILSVDLDTLTAVEIVDRAFGQVRLHEIAKVKCVEQMMQEHVEGDRLLAQLGLLTVEA